MQSVTVAGGTLFRVALDWLGDGTQWVRIAQLNGLTDPMLSGLMMLQLPVVNPGAGGGIVRQ